VELAGIVIMITVFMLPGNICGLILESKEIQGNFPTFYSLKLSNVEALAVNSHTNKIYVADSGSNKLIIIDGNSGNITSIPVGREPHAIAIDPDLNNMSDKVTLIDGDTNKNETNIPVGDTKAIAVNPNYHAMYIAPTARDDVMIYTWGSGGYELEGGGIPSGGHPMSIAVNPNTNLIYAVNSNNDSVSVINGITHMRVTDIHVGPKSGGGYPNAIAVNTNTSKIYVAISNYAAVSVINGNTESEPHYIQVGKTPEAIAVNPVTNKIYVANEDNDIVSVIDGSTDTRVTDIQVGKTPEAIAVNPNGNTIYVANSGREESVTVIDGNTNKVAAGVTFNIDPAHSGQIVCKNVEAPTNQYFYIGLGTQCTALPNKGFEFNSWVENLLHNSTIPLSKSAILDSPWNSFLSIIGRPSTSMDLVLLLLILRRFLLLFHLSIRFHYTVLSLVL
jgi:YVTN family beta-propeller protein